MFGVEENEHEKKILIFKRKYEKNKSFEILKIKENDSNSFLLLIGFSHAVLLIVLVYYLLYFFFNNKSN